MHKGIVKHCFESKFIGKEPSYHIGFSPQNNVRIMVTFLRLNEIQTTLYQHISNGTEKYFAINYNDPVKTGETHLVCLDTENQTIMSVQGSKILTAKYHSFPVEELEWFAFFDGARNTINQSSRVSINLGFTDFINKIPLFIFRALSAQKTGVLDPQPFFPAPFKALPDRLRFD